MYRRFLVLLLFMFQICLVFSCTGNSGQEKKITEENNIQPKEQTRKPISRKDTTIKKFFKGRSVPVNVVYSDSAVGTILVLPGWNYSDTEWCVKTVLCKEAKKSHFNLLFVEMQRSVYMKEYYAETRKDYATYPTRTWLMDSVVFKLFSDEIIDKALPFFVMGLSTGGRGAAILALEHPDVFRGAATLSGDFDPEHQKDDALMINSLGSYAKFPERWKGDNNIIRRIKEFKVPLYVGHGLADKVSPPTQSLRLVDSLKKYVPALKVKTNFPKTRGHDYPYWNAEVRPVLDFFTGCML